MRAIVLLLTLPLAYRLIPNPVMFQWEFVHGRREMPSGVRRNAERVGYLLPFVEQVAIVVVVLMMARRAEWSAQRFGLGISEWQSIAIQGLIAGTAWLVLYAAILSVASSQTRRLAAARISRLPVWFSVSSGLSSALVEEAWRASCLVALADRSCLGAIAAVAVATGLAHGLPLGRLLSTMLFGAYAAVAFIWTGSLWIPVLAHLVVNWGTPLLLRSVRD